MGEKNGIPNVSRLASAADTEPPPSFGPDVL